MEEKIEEKKKEKNVDELQNQIKNIEREENNQKLKDNVQKRYLEGRIAVNKNLLNKNNIKNKNNINNKIILIKIILNKKKLILIIII